MLRETLQNSLIVCIKKYAYTLNKQVVAKGEGVEGRKEIGEGN